MSVRKVQVMPRIFVEAPPPPRLIDHVDHISMTTCLLLLGTAYLVPQGRVPLLGMAFNRLSTSLDPLYLVISQNAQRALRKLQIGMLGISVLTFGYSVFKKAF